MEIKIVNQKSTPTEIERLQAKEKAELPQQTIEGAEPDAIRSIAIKQVLEIEGNKPEYEKEVKILVNWAKGQVDGDDSDYFKLRWAVRDLKMRLGTPPFGDPIKHLARYAYLDMEGKRIEQEKDHFR